MPLLPRLLRRVALALSLLLAAGTTGALTAAPAGAAATVPVVAAENFWGSVAAQLGGPAVRVTSIISNPNTDPHEYTADAANALAVSRAAVVIQNGAGYDDFMSQLLGAAGHRGQRVVTVASVLHVRGADPNPHLWYEVDAVPTVAAAIEAALVRADPAGRAAFAARLRAFDASVAPIRAVLARIDRRYAGTPVAYTERVPGYTLAEAGLANRTPADFASAIEDGNDPSAAATEAMDQLLMDHKVRVLLYNTQTVSPVTSQVRALARREGIGVVGVSETLPAGVRTWQRWQLDQDRALLGALARSRG
jgi:zinc/manganese transport system substrate-binding protein